MDKVMDEAVGEDMGTKDAPGNGLEVGLRNGRRFGCRDGRRDRC